ncbi:MAG TPA: GNAT family N-acetyltransferase [Streptosporangiaceae bacterium]|jgi:hypothetical protein
MTRTNSDPPGGARAGEVTIRPIAGPEEVELFNRLPYALNHEMAGDLAAGRRRPSWMWMALRGGRPVARLAWWARDGAAEPFLMDTFDLDESAPDAVDVGERLVRTALAATVGDGVWPPQYLRFVPAAWRDDPVVRPAVEARMAALERTGARLFVERLRLEWRAGTPVPAPSGRLRFRATDRDEMRRLMAGVLEGTLDAHSQADLAEAVAETAATEAAAGGEAGAGVREPGAGERALVAMRQYDGEFRSYASPLEWHRVAELPGGEGVGFVVPARNSYNAIIAYIGVLPAHRGKGYIDDILAEGTRLLVAEADPPRIRASTDLGNVPMARAFARAGYDDFEHQIDMVWR